MRLSKIYSSNERVFPPITFRRGLNVVFGEIRRPESRGKDTHNLGKTILSKVIDYCLLRQKSPEFFLFKHQEIFKRFVFFLEIETDANGYVTVRRSADEDEASKAAFKYHKEPNQDFSRLDEPGWDHWRVAFDRSVELLDGVLALTAISPWNYRHAIGYSLRTQDDYAEPFHLSKFLGSHAEWKPLLAHIIGLDDRLVTRNYELAAEIERKQGQEQGIRALKLGAEEPDKIRGLVRLKEREIRRLEEEVDRQDFHESDSKINRTLVESLDLRIAEGNEARYYLTAKRQQIEGALADRVDFDLGRAKSLFEAAKIYFGEQVVKDYDALDTFNRSLVQERAAYLRTELKQITASIAEVDGTLASLNQERSAALHALREAEAFVKYKRMAKQVTEEKVHLEVLKRQERAAEELEEVRAEVQKLVEQQRDTQEMIRRNLSAPGRRYEEVGELVDDVAMRVIGQHAVMYTSVNKNGNVDFKLDIEGAEGKATGAGEGYSYGRMLCLAFDMAIMRSYAKDRYAHFVYHDGALESLDDRKKLNLIELIRDTSTPLGTQQIITVIDSELPRLPDGERFQFAPDEIIRILHDDGDEGRLFRMPSW